MKLGPATSFITGGTGAAAIGLLTLSPWLRAADPVTSRWALSGFLAMVVPGLFFGAWMAHEHGRKSTRFAVALGAGFLTRMTFAGALTFRAARMGPEAISPLLPGLGAGFLSIIAFETLWFALGARRERRSTEVRG